MATENNSGVQLESSAKGKLRVGSFGNQADRVEAANSISRGEVVAVQVRGVYGLLARGDDWEAVKRVFAIKRSPIKTLSKLGITQDLQGFIDLDAIPDKAKPLVLDLKRLQERIGAIGHVRYPVVKELYDRYPAMVSQEGNEYYVHNLDLWGQDEVCHLIGLLREENIPMAVTSLNDHSIGEAEISEMPRATEFCLASEQLDLLLTDPLTKRANIKGSFAIVDIENMSVIRDGHIPARVVEKLLGLGLDQNGMKSVKHEQSADFDRLLKFNFDSGRLRLAVLDYLSGMEVEEIWQKYTG